MRDGRCTTVFRSVFTSLESKKGTVYMDKVLLHQQLERPHLVAVPRPTGIEALCRFELIWVKRCVDVEHVILAPPGFCGGELLVCLCGVKFTSTKEATAFSGFG